MIWFRVEHDEAGNLKSCAEIAWSEFKRQDRTFYVEAECREMAIAHASYLAKQRDARRSRRRRYREAGLCPSCGRDPGENIYCRVCLDCSENSKARARAKVRSESVAPLPPKSVALERRAESLEFAIRLAILEEVHQAWLHSQTDQAFTGWLMSAIATAKRKAA
jgi:hypothetical protein